MNLPPRNTKAIAILFGILVLSGITYLAIALKNSSPNNNQEAPSTTIPTAGPITIEGMMVCLPHDNTDGPQTLECAYGLKDAANRYFALSDTDPMHKNVSSVPMNVPVKVVGMFTPQESDTYQSIGVIVVTSITPITDGENQ